MGDLLAAYAERQKPEDKDVLDELEEEAEEDEDEEAAKQRQSKQVGVAAQCALWPGPCTYMSRSSPLSVQEPCACEVKFLKAQCLQEERRRAREERRVAELVEPGVAERHMLTKQDDLIRSTDTPERYQLAQDTPIAQEDYLAAALWASRTPCMITLD